MTGYAPLSVAIEIIRRLKNRLNRTATNLDIQKLAYFSHGWHLALLDEPLVSEDFEAWRFGPVLPSIYQMFKVFSSNPIPPDHPLVALSCTNDVEAGSLDLIDRVLDVYGATPSFELVRMSHAPDGPWAKVWDPSWSSKTIDNAKIQEYFVGLSRK